MARTIRNNTRNYYRKPAGGRGYLAANEAAEQQGVQVRNLEIKDRDRAVDNESGNISTVARRLADRQWGCARIARHLQRKFGIEYAEALEITEWEMDLTKPVQGEVVGKDRKREQAKKHAEAKQRKKRARRIEEEKMKEKAHALHRKESPMDRADDPDADCWYFLKKNAPNLLQKEYIRPLERLFALSPVRPLEEWKPLGKSPRRLFNSLAVHLLAAYPMPDFLWSAFFEQNSRTWIGIVQNLASGKGLYALCQKGILPVPLTRKQCHHFMRHRASWTVQEALRDSQMLGLGASSAFLNAWMNTPQGRRLSSPTDEAFWMAVMHWCLRQGMLDPNDLGPLSDFIRERRRQEPTFTVIGRTEQSIMRMVQEWHQELSERKYPNLKFTSCGLPSEKWIIPKQQTPAGEAAIPCEMREILTSKELREEGSKQNHCVFSYCESVNRGSVSIWSFRMQNTRCLTLEIENASKTLRQVRGKFNRKATEWETKALRSWFDKNQIKASPNLI